MCRNVLFIHFPAFFMSFIAKISLPLRKSKTRGDHIVFITMDAVSNTTTL